MTSKGMGFPHRWASDKALAIDGLRPGLAWLFLEMERQRRQREFQFLFQWEGIRQPWESAVPSFSPTGHPSRTGFLVIPGMYSGIVIFAAFHPFPFP